jgi:hypothetical protein
LHRRTKGSEKRGVIWRNPEIKSGQIGLIDLFAQPKMEFTKIMMTRDEG